jgi:hypothetical protein
VGAGLYPPATNPQAPRGIRYYSTVGTTSYVGDTETRAFLTTWKAEASRLYRITLSVGNIDTDGVGDNATVRYAKNSMVIKARWASGTTADVADSDLGYRLQTVFDDDSMSASGQTCVWYLGGAPAGDLAVAITIKAYRAAATYGSVRIIGTGGSSATLTVDDIGPWPVV